VKRFTETGKWSDPWFLGLSLDSKLAFWYITENCDGAGVWDPNKRLANFCFTRDLDWDQVKTELGDRIEVLPSGKWHLTRFVDFQYGVLSPECRPHAFVIKLREKHGIKGYAKGIDTLTDTDKEKDKEKDAEKSRFPTREEWLAECAQKHADWPQTDALGAWNHYESQGWMRGRSKITRWRACIETCYANFKRRGKTNGNHATDQRPNSRRLECAPDYSQIKSHGLAPKV
jgi:hypothetical protein